MFNGKGKLSMTAAEYEVLSTEVEYKVKLESRWRLWILFFNKCFPWWFHICIWYILVSVLHSHPEGFSSSSQPCFPYLLVCFLFRALQSLTRGTCVTSDLDLSFRYWWGFQRLHNWILRLSLFHNLLVTKCSTIKKKISRGFKRSPKRWRTDRFGQVYMWS